MNITKRPPIPYYVRALAMGIPAYLIGVHLWTWVFMAPVMIGGRADFRQLYAAGYMLRTGHRAELYGYDAQTRFQNQQVGLAEITLPFNHLAYEALAFAPFSLFSYRQAYLEFVAVNCALVGLCFAVMWRRLRSLGDVFLWLPFALFVAFLPIAAALIQGQDSIMLLSLLVVAHASLREKPIVAGMLCGLGMFKFQIVLPIVILFAAWKAWKFVGGFAVSSTITTAISVWLVGAANMRAYLVSLIGMSRDLDRTRFQISPENMPNVRGLVYGFLGSGHRLFWLTIALSVAILIYLGVQRKIRSFEVAVLGSALVSYHFLIHDAAILALPVFIAMAEHVDEEGTQRAGRWVFRAACLVFTSPLLVSFAPHFFFLASIPLGLVLFLTLSVTSARVRRGKSHSQFRPTLVSSG